MTTQVRDRSDEMDYNHPNLAYNVGQAHQYDEEKY